MKEKRKTDVAIIGGGASGLAAAIRLKMLSAAFDVLIIEKMSEPGRKLRATGNGRCNITNTEALGYERIMDFFAEIGLAARIYDNGLVYPHSEAASDVVSLLVDRASSLGAVFACDEEVISLEKKDGKFEITSLYRDKKGEHRIHTTSDYVILACGGKAGPSYGTTGDGYRLAGEIGHSIITPVPALTGIECAEWEGDSEPCAIAMAGTRTAANVSLYKHTNEGQMEHLITERGELQFTKYGLSGICVFNLTRHMRFDKTEGESLGNFEIKVNLYPDGELDKYIAESKAGFFSKDSIGKLLCTLVKKPIANYALDILETSHRNIKKKAIADLTADEVEALDEAIHAVSFRPERIRGWKDAQVTMGGVSLDEINPDTSESLVTKGLYITGELADRDFPCGGFNLSNAWISGISAAEDIAEK